MSYSSIYDLIAVFLLPYGVNKDVYIKPPLKYSICLPFCVLLSESWSNFYTASQRHKNVLVAFALCKEFYAKFNELIIYPPFHFASRRILRRSL
jgi:hypothetical protein